MVRERTRNGMPGLAQGLRLLLPIRARSHNRPMLMAHPPAADAAGIGWIYNATTGGLFWDADGVDGGAILVAMIAGERDGFIASEINVYAELLVGATDGWNGGTAAMNFEHTATLALTLPDGYTFTSESGMLFAREPPATLQAFAACGVGLVVARRRRCGAARP